MKYITLFETIEDYNTATLDLPNVSLIEETMSVGYKPYVPETRVVCKYNVTDTSSPTPLRTSYEQNIFKSMEIDGVMLDELVTAYTFGTTGIHTVKYELYDETKLGNTAPVFYNDKLIECIIPDSVTSIGDLTFYNCYNLTSIDIPDSVTSIGHHAFYYCSSLTGVTIPDNIINISDYAFQYCSSLTSVTIPDSVTSIDDSAFYGCSGLTSIVIPDSITSIDANVFNGCSGLTNVTIGSGVISIGNYAFQDCSSLASINIPDSVTSIGSGVFTGCSGLASMTVDSNNTVYDSRNNCNAIIETTTNTLIAGCNNTVISDSVTSIGGSAFYNCTGLTSIDIPNSVTSIGSNAFAGCTGLTSIDIPDSVTSIGPGAFSSCDVLTSIDIPDNVTSIDANVFNGCSGLTNVTIGSGVISIGNYAFQNCSSLASINIPDSVTSIGNFAFRDCSSLTSIVCNATTAPTIGNYTFYGVKTGGTLTIPSGSTGYDAWMSTDDYYLGKYNWTKVEPIENSFFCKLTLNDNSVVELEGSGELTSTMTQNYKSTLVSAEIGELCTRIGDSAFYNCTGLTSVTIPDSVTHISYAAFENCTGLTSVTIPDSVTIISNRAFLGCSSLTSIIANAMIAPDLPSNAFQKIKTGGTLTVPAGSTGYDQWMSTGYYLLGYYNWTKVEQ